MWLGEIIFLEIFEMQLTRWMIRSRVRVLFGWKIYSFECQEETKLTEIKRKGVLLVDWTE